MKVVHLLSYWDETPSMLGNSIKSASQLCDAVVALEGRYALFPDDRIRSPREQLQTIDWAASEYGLEMLHYSPGKPWKDEISKRNYHFRLAECITDPNDWFYIQDGDTVLAECQITPEILANTPEKVGITRHREAFGERIVDNDIRNLFRAERGIHLSVNHYTYRDAEENLLWGNQTAGESIPGADFKTKMVLHHFNQKRDEERMEQAQIYYSMRDEEGSERGPCQVCHEQIGFLNYPATWKRIDGGKALIADWMEICEDCLPEYRRKTFKQVRRLGFDPMTIQFKIHPLGPLIRLRDLHQSKAETTESILTKT